MNITIKSEGRNTPLQSLQSCMQKAQEYPEPPDKSCTVATKGGLTGKGSMQMECAGPPPYSIKIEGTRTASTMKGTMTIISSGTTMVQDFAGKVVGSCDVATFVPKSPAGGGMPSAGMQMPSFDPSMRRPKQVRPDDASPRPVQQTEAEQAQVSTDSTDSRDSKEPKDTPKDSLGTAVDAAKKALGGLFGL